MDAHPKGGTCFTCIWFKPRTEEQRKRFVSADSFCGWQAPPALRSATWGIAGDATKIIDETRQWCSAHDASSEDLDDQDLCAASPALSGPG